MNQIVTRGIVLARIDYGEADRIITLLTPDHGKLRLMAKGVRKVKSKLAGGIELFSVSQIAFIRGRGDIGTLVSTRLERHYGSIIKHIERVQLGYELIKQLNKATEDEPEAAYFYLMEQAFAALDEPKIPTELVKIWFAAQLLRFGGHTPNLRTDSARKALEQEALYNFDTNAMAFTRHPEGIYNAGNIKFLRLIFGDSQPPAIARVQGAGELSKSLLPLVQHLESAQAN